MLKWKERRADVAKQEWLSLKKGQKIVYDGEEAEVIKISPLLILKTKTRVICGELNDSSWGKPLMTGEAKG